ncbi:MAG: hypothetical protein HZA14_10905 [Nitrospirae bacterium]|nr:hypothetical protein [Nitrospirota bacterium]
MLENDNTLEIQKEPEAHEKHTVVGIRFRACGKVYTFELEDIDAAPGTRVVVESEMGLSIGHVVKPKHAIDKPEAPLKKVLRLASEEDFEAIKSNRSLEEEAKAFCVNRSKELNLPMKIVAAETTLDKKRLIFYFTADGRIDFRELVRDLAAKFKTRIEMRQIGVRDEVKLLGGIGVCGRETCCSLFLTNFEPVTIKMAKQQELSINQSKLSGICGRLMCCLGYECREPHEAEHEAEDAAVVQDENLMNVTEEPAGDLQQPIEASGRSDSGEAAAQPQPEKFTERERHPGHRRRRSRRRFHDRPAQDKPSQQNQPPQQQQQPEGAEKGKPFNRRRKFWKKKKHEQK